MAKPTTSAEITFLLAHAELADHLIPYHEDSNLTENNLVTYSFNEIEPDPWWLSKFREHLIPYSFKYGAGQDWESGAESFRFDKDGLPQWKEFRDIDQNPDIKQLKTLLETPQALVEFIKLHIEKTATFPWETQEANTKVARLKKLITT